ncbi:hypothetical protein CVT25_013050 [Psilocybe cyanescens]|uniref:Uncharacterized protein n=1 Tax=Psilocybe cyanescens TaxID=93625 RepID=A0A409X109_PSICY|nr:hypothetical protein CVT25_013050 [Psilocybe cyanescens]
MTTIANRPSTPYPKPGSSKKKSHSYGMPGGQLVDCVETRVKARLVTDANSGAASTSMIRKFRAIPPVCVVYGDGAARCQEWCAAEQAQG